MVRTTLAKGHALNERLLILHMLALRTSSRVPGQNPVELVCISTGQHFHSRLQRPLTYSTIPNLMLRQRLHTIHMLLAFSSVLLCDQEQLYRPEERRFGESCDERLELNLYCK